VFSKADQSSKKLPGYTNVFEAAAQPITAAAWRAAAGIKIFW